MEEDLFEKILKELLNGKSLRELQEKYHLIEKDLKKELIENILLVLIKENK